jgi:hypothetical protein
MKKRKRLFLAEFTLASLDDWLTVHRSIILVDFQLDAGGRGT